MTDNPRSGFSDPHTRRAEARRLHYEARCAGFLPRRGIVSRRGAPAPRVCNTEVLSVFRSYEWGSAPREESPHSGMTGLPAYGGDEFSDTGGDGHFSYLESKSFAGKHTHPSVTEQGRDMAVSHRLGQVLRRMGLI